MPFYILHSLVRTQLLYNITYTFFVLIQNCFSSFLRSKDK
ncbi:hypothetical protein CLOSTMETH_03725 [[Clostridium] methylpentosum DSM 5476]|uniref:Uncharacterized protein n=1 Tax=[Clostridium] methylpentosum DSM 5476 TaxID=537013 RepID=C0EIN0_9FIRM|nr:hypothetical protein CLOSTMETH_03725 [[Clostridium] methylpentosum DSM 5476]